jgi:GAF domain-containing protein
VDFLTSAYLSQTRLALAIDAAVTIGLAFVLHRAYRWIESAVDFMLFRRKHEAERYLDRVAHTLMFAEREEAVDKALVHDPYDKLRLTAAALYRAREGAYVAARLEGWTALNAPQLCSDDDLVRFMIAERCKIVVGDLRSHVAEPFRAQGHTPTIAIPIFQGNRLTGFAVYGIHRDGTKLDPDEVETLERLCAAAAQAYTGIELARYQGAEARSQFATV